MTAPITSAGYISASTAFVTNEGFTYTQVVPSVVSTVVVGTSTSFVEISVTNTDTQTPATKAFATISSQPLLVYASDFDFMATAPCCSTCTIYGGEVQVCKLFTFTLAVIIRGQDTPLGNWKLYSS